MKTKELFLKDPLTWKLVNEGVSSNSGRPNTIQSTWIHRMNRIMEKNNLKHLCFFILYILSIHVDYRESIHVD